MRPLAVVATLFVLFSGHALGAEFDFKYPPPSDQGSLERKSVWSTRYQIHPARAATSPNGAMELLKRDGTGFSIFLSPKNLCNAGMEGTVSVETDKALRTFNVDGMLDDEQVDCRPFFPHAKPEVIKRLGRQSYVEVSGNRRFGLGVAGFRLVPFRTIATDRTKLASGTVLYIDGLRGRSISLPDGSTVKHDGYVFAGDSGGLIKGNHIDFFTGLSPVNPAPEVITSSPARPFTALVVTDQAIIDGLTKLHQLK